MPLFTCAREEHRSIMTKGCFARVLFCALDSENKYSWQLLSYWLWPVCMKDLALEEMDQAPPFDSDFGNPSEDIFGSHGGSGIAMNDICRFLLNYLYCCIAFIFHFGGVVSKLLAL